MHLEHVCESRLQCLTNTDAHIRVFHIGTFFSDQAAIASSVGHWPTEHTDFFSRITNKLYVHKPTRIVLILNVEKNKNRTSISKDGAGCHWSLAYYSMDDNTATYADSLEWLTPDSLLSILNEHLWFNGTIKYLRGKHEDTNRSYHYHEKFK